MRKRGGGGSEYAVIRSAPTSLPTRPATGVPRRGRAPYLNVFLIASTLSASVSFNFEEKSDSSQLRRRTAGELLRKKRKCLGSAQWSVCVVHALRFPLVRLLPGIFT